MLRDGGVGAGQEHPEVGVMRQRRPHLLTAHPPLVTVAHGAGLQRGHVGACAGLAEELTPCGPTAGDVGEVPTPLLVVAPGEDGRSRHVHTHAGRSPGEAAPPQLVDDLHRVGPPEAAPRPLAGPRGGRPAGGPEPIPPLAEGQVGVPMVVQPPRELACDADGSSSVTARLPIPRESARGAASSSRSGGSRPRYGP